MPQTTPRDRAIEVGAWLLETSHRTLLTLTGGRFPKRLIGMQPVELVTVGRKTGQRRSTLLTAPICDEQRVVLVASKGGHSDDPLWYKNLAANPDVDIIVNGTARHLRARTASAEEKAALWPQITATYKGYEGYQRATTRDIPVVICEPVAP
ncbi:MAG TPA: nitroreductase/quinone reductase family protein [Acidimicrobiales bacterium]|nr:nitroreductase/quinone reductase family protein [Acidimicrobiales bacterium]